MNVTTRPNFRFVLALVIGLYLTWVFVTYLLEGRILTFQRPEATGARLVYAVVANILIGLGGSILIVRALSKLGVISPVVAGFRGVKHSIIAVPIGAVLGFAFYVLQGPPIYNPVVILNAYAQVLVVSVAEILVCWAVVGSVCEALLVGTGRLVSGVLAAIIASVLFGVYHFAHSPPFNTIGVVVLLSVIGLVTSLFFFISKDVYGTIAFHNFLGIFGVIRGLETSGTLGSFKRPVIPLMVVATVAVVLLIAAHIYVIASVNNRAPS